MNAMNYLSAFNSKRHQPGNIISDIDALLSAESIDARFIPFGCEWEKIRWISDRAINNRKASLIWSDDTLYYFILEYKYKENGKSKRANGKFFILQDAQYRDSFVAITIESSEFLTGLYCHLFNRYIQQYC